MFPKLSLKKQAHARRQEVKKLGKRGEKGQYVTLILGLLSTVRTVFSWQTIFWNPGPGACSANGHDAKTRIAFNIRALACTAFARLPPSATDKVVAVPSNPYTHSNGLPKLQIRPRPPPPAGFTSNNSNNTFAGCTIIHEDMRRRLPVKQQHHYHQHTHQWNQNTTSSTDTHHPPMSSTRREEEE